MNKPFIINGRFLSQKMTGVHRYSYQMCCSLKQLGANFTIVAPRKILPQYDLDGFDIERCGRFNSHLWEQLELPLYLYRRHKGKKLVSLMGLGSILYNKTICTVHDLSYIENPAWFSKSYYFFYKIMTPITVHRALMVVTVSNFSRQELIDILKVPSEKIKVIYNAATIFPTSKTSISKSEKQYILAVSSLDPRKNLRRLIEAFALLPQKDYKLYIIGVGNRVFALPNLETVNRENIIFPGYVDDIQLGQYYSGATLFVAPSLYEGFGLPTLEAMTNSCPVVASDIAPHHEVCGDAAIYFDPENIYDMASKISDLLADRSKQLDMISKGIERVKNFSWNMSATQLLQIIDQKNL